jgi:glycosyltransferase involved in cell wall biosynthesis
VLESVAPQRRHPESTAYSPSAMCRTLLMVGTDARGEGGISSVVSGYLAGGLFERFPGTYVATHRNGSRWTKVTAAVVGLARVAIQLRSLEAPLVHVQTASRASFWRKAIVCLMARMAGRPYIVHLHGGEFVQFYQNESGWLVRRYVRHVLSHAALVIALSSQVQRTLLEIAPDAKVEILENAVKVPDIDRIESPATRPPTVVFLGALSHSKGVFDLLEAFARVAGDFAEARLVFGGRGAVEVLRQRAQQLGIASRVSFPGWISAAAKDELLASAAVLVLASYAEGLPMAVLEAMSWGTPVIASRVGAIPQVIEDDVNGLLVNPGDIESLTAALGRVMGDPALRDRLARSARSTVESDYAADAMLARLGRIYRRFGLVPRQTRATHPGVAP